MIVLCLLALLGFASAQQTATVTINNVATPLWETSPLLWGLMYEEIGHQGAGGLHTELLQNGFFQTTTITPWTVQAIGGGSASECNMTLDANLPHINEVLPRSMSLAAIGTHACGAVNTGYPNGIGIIAGVKYNVSLWAHVPVDATAAGSVTVQLWDSSSNVLGELTISGIGGFWSQFKGQITTTITKSVSSVKFVVIVPTGAHVWLHGISLAPDTNWRGLPYIRPDLGDMMAAIKAAHFRFPGGCFVEGDTMVDAYRWKKAIGAYIERPGVYNGVWGYYSPNFLGPFELLNFAEKLGAAPIWVVNAGASHKDYVDDYELQDYIQDAVDAVEFAIGDETTYWGAKRAAMGHPAPFNPDTFYIAIGNEQDFNNLNPGGLPLYKKNYPLFYAAIKERFPNQKVVANNATVIVGGLEADDQVAEFHDYDPAERFVLIREQWATWRVSKYMYVSEYGASCSSSSPYCPSPWAAAIAEGAFMLGMERYSNYVIMACSETLGQQAAFNALQTYGTPNYWGKWTFASEQGTHVIDTQMVSTSGGNITITALALTRKAASGGGLEMVFKLVNWGPNTVTVTVQANGFPSGWQLGSVATSWTVMNGTTSTSQNSFDHPNEVGPHTVNNLALDMIAAGQSFVIDVPYSSINVAVIPLVQKSDIESAPRHKLRHRNQH